MRSSPAGLAAVGVLGFSLLAGCRAGHDGRRAGFSPDEEPPARPGAGAAIADAAVDAREGGAEGSADAALPASCPGCGFWDPGFALGTWRTDFDDPTRGLSSRPLSLMGCPFALDSDPEVLNGAGPTYFDPSTQRQVACDRASTTYRASNASTSSVTWPQDLFWVVTANNETSFGPEGACADDGPNTGPPNQSKTVSTPGRGVFGVDVSGGRATLALDTQQFPNCVSPIDSGKIPFLSLGAQKGRGQGDRAITYLNDDRYPAVLKFKATLEDLAPAGVASSTHKARANFGYLFVEVEWSGLRRWAYIDLFSRSAMPTPFTRVHWNWNIRESMWYPGAEILFVDAGTLASSCASAKIVAAAMPASVGSSFAYAIDLNALFRCMSTVPDKPWTSPLPTTPLVVSGVHWAIEQTYGKNWTRMSIQDLDLTR